MSIRALIADDEPVARRGLRYLLARETDVQIVAECASGEETARTIEQTNPDVVFLDIRMPDLDGFGVVDRVRTRPMPLIVFVTAFDEFAIAAFEAAAIDYVTKPVAEARFQTTLARVRERLADPQRDRILIRARDRIDVVAVADIDWIESAGDFACVHAGGATHVLSESLRALEERLDAARFVRIHRSRIVNADRIGSICRLFHGEYLLTLHNGTRLSAGRHYTARLKSFFSERFAR